MNNINTIINVKIPKQGLIHGGFYNGYTYFVGVSNMSNENVVISVITQFNNFYYDSDYEVNLNDIHSWKLINEKFRYKPDTDKHFFYENEKLNITKDEMFMMTKNFLENEKEEY